MRSGFLFLSLFLLSLTAFSLQAEARYRYSGPGCNFRITFPEAPTVRTIWPDDPLPFWEATRGFDEVGEEAVYARNYPGIGKISFKATCVKADKALIDGFDQESMFFTLKELYSGYKILNEDMKYSDDAERGIKWASISGYHVTEDGQSEAIAAHFTIGQSSIMIIQSSLIGEDKYLQEEYSDILYSIIAE